MTAIVVIGIVLIGAALVAFRPHDEARGIALGLAVILTFFGTRVQSDRTGGYVFAGVLILLSLAVLRARPFEHGVMKVPLTRSLLPLSYFALAALVTATANTAALSLYLRIFVFAALALLAATGASRRDIRLIYAGLVANGVVQLLMGAVEIAQKRPLWGYVLNRSGTGEFVQTNELFTTTIPRLEGSTGHSIVFGIAMALAAVAVFLLVGRKPVRAAVCALPFVAGVLLSGARSAVLALGIVIVYAFFVRSTHMNFALRLGGIGVMAGGALLGSGYFQNLLDAFRASGSYTNRIEGVSSASSLLGRTLSESLFGSGSGSEGSLFDRGFLQQSNLFRTVDNQFVTTLATVGLLGLLLLLLSIIVAWRRGPTSMRPLLLFFVTMFFSFDALNWFSGVVVIAILLAARGESGTEPVADRDELASKTGAAHPRQALRSNAPLTRVPNQAAMPRHDHGKSKR